MTLLFLSNYFNHHQKPFSDAMYRRLGDGYRFVETEAMSDERKKLGWGNIERPSYVLTRNEDNKDEIQALIDSANAVIIGSAPDFLIRHRLKQNKLIFRYAERPDKQSPPLWKFLARQLVWRKRYPARKPMYMLCASAYTASDYARYGCFRGKCFKWGYFPETKRYADLQALVDRKKPASILWTARFIDWKHPEIAVEVAKRLRRDGYVFELNMIGNGVMLESIRAQIEQDRLTDCVHLLGSMTPEQVREHMERSEIFLFTSDRNEGWGAVLNESMNSACAVIADDAIGSVPFLIEEGKNGLTYQTGDIDGIVQKVKYLLDHTAERQAMGREAYRTITEEWNAEVAAERLIEATQYKDKIIFWNDSKSGLLSIIKQR